MSYVDSMIEQIKLNIWIIDIYLTLDLSSNMLY
jgi:hypothetical protein